MNIQWYPGNMTKTKRMIEKEIAIVDVVVELLDARIPISSKNPYIDELVQKKEHIVVLNKIDLADDVITKAWTEKLNAQGLEVVQISAAKDTKINDIEKIARRQMKQKIEIEKAKGKMNVPIRLLVVGIPNVGKSTFINKLVGKCSAKTGNKPGITRGQQWIKLKKDFELVDTPGILMPKFEDERVGMFLAFTGAINDAILDKETLALELVKQIINIKPQALEDRYNIQFENDATAIDILQKIAEQRGFKLKGNIPDVTRSANTLIDEFRAGKLGKITLEAPQQ